jgi:hypothetical protein
MTCADVERILPELLDGAPDQGFQSAFEFHLQSCADCSDLVSDLKLISHAAQDMAEAEEPAPRVWLNIAAQLREEGLIREPGTAPMRHVRSAPGRWSAWWLIPAMAALLAAGAYIVNHKPVPQVAQQQVRATQPSAETTAPTPAAAAQPSQQAQLAEQTAQSPQQMARTSKLPKHIVEPEPSTDDQQFLSEVSTRAPSMKATYEKQLHAVNNEIREVQAYLERNPDDADARQHLMDAYEQKALLYQIALDRIQ